MNKSNISAHAQLNGIFNYNKILWRHQAHELFSLMMRQHVNHGHHGVLMCGIWDQQWNTNGVINFMYRAQVAYASVPLQNLCQSIVKFQKLHPLMLQ